MAWFFVQGWPCAPDKNHDSPAAGGDPQASQTLAAVDFESGVEFSEHGFQRQRSCHEEGGGTAKDMTAWSVAEL
jgi:hypothetical protein